MLEEHIKTIETFKHGIAKTWTQSQIIKPILSTKLLTLGNFENKYAVAVIEYFIGVVKKEKQLGDCPIMHQMLQDFASANISSEEIFIICAQLKRTLVNFSFDSNFSSQENIDQINYMLDENFRGVIRLYDVTLHEHTLKLEELEEHLKQYTDAIDASTIISKADPKGIITYVNEAFEEISGYSKEEVIGKPHNIVRHPDMKASFFEDMWKTLQSKKMFNAVIKNKAKNGEDYYVKSYILPILDANKNIAEYIAIRQDITEQIESVQREHRINILKDDFLRNVSHEIKTPLSSVVSMAGLLKKKIDNPKLESYVSIINDGAQQIDQIISSILKVSQFMSKAYAENIQATDIFQGLTDFFNVQKTLAAEKNIEYEYEIDSALHKPLECDMELIQTILLELSSNAIKFNDTNGKVEVKINLVSDMLSIHVKDDGIGISKKEQEHIFDVFYQADASVTRKYEGLGIGLALVSEIINFLDGSITLKSAKGMGSLFVVNIKL